MSATKSGVTENFCQYDAVPGFSLQPASIPAYVLIQA
nr:MAG TPA: hypothetical protein [Bacteriophage sp.]